MTALRLEWIEMARLRCPQDGVPYRVMDIVLLGTRGDACLLRCRCRVCATTATGLLIVREIHACKERGTEPERISIDDTLEAHEALRHIDRLPPDITGSTA